MFLLEPLLGFKLEPPVEPQREKLTLGAQAWQRHQAKKPNHKAADLWEKAFPETFLI